MVAPGLDDDLEGFFVGSGHDDHMRGARLGHHLGLEVAAVHRLQVGHDRGLREGLAQGADAVEPFRQDERRARFEPIDSRP